jgi:uncharacterized membrane protein YdbT with pleckstrin-like domain
MSYVENNLLPEEKILFTGNISGAIYLRPVISLLGSGFLYYLLGRANQTSDIFQNLVRVVWVIVFLFLLGYTLLLLIQAIIIFMTSEFAVTNKRILVKTGFIRRSTIEILLSKVESISVDQNILGRMMNFGTIVIRGTGGTAQKARAIADPMTLRKKINLVLEKVNSRSVT